VNNEDIEKGAVVAVDCRKCAHVFDVKEGYSYRCAKSDTLMPWSVVASDPCEDFVPSSASLPVVDCRECAHIFDIVEGDGFRCTATGMRFPWRLVASDPCAEFQPKPTDSPPASADREGPDVLAALRSVTSWDWPALLIHEEDAAEILGDLAALERAITDEEARRARPAAEDPRDVELHDLRAKIAELGSRHLPLSLRQDPSDETIRDWYERTSKHENGMRALLGRCATVLDLVAGLRSVGKYRSNGDFLVDGDAYETTHASAKQLLASIRAAGVEPAPEEPHHG